MVLRFNMLLREAGIDPSSVRLLRHYPVLPNGVVLIDQLHRDRSSLLAWQSVQSAQRRPHLAAPLWASFLGTPDGRTVFEGLYRVGPVEPLLKEVREPLSDEIVPAGTCDRYLLEHVAELEPYSGRLLIEWGGGSPTSKNLSRAALDVRCSRPATCRRECSGPEWSRA